MFYAFRHIHKVTLIQTCLSTFVHIPEDSGIFRILVLPVPKTSTCSSSQVLLVFLCSNLFGTFYHFCFKGKHSTFFLKDGLSITTITIIISCNMRLLITHTTLTTHLTHTTHVNMPPTPMSTTQPTLSRYPHHPRNPHLRITHTSMLPTQVPTYATYAHILPMSLTVARIECHFSNSTMKVMVQVVKFLLKVHTVFIQLF